MKHVLALLLSVIILFSANAEPPSFMHKSPKDGLWEALEYYDIHHKEIVYAQAILETGHFKSGGCHKGHNLFGLRGKHYHRYKHWSESVKAYKEKIQSRYKQEKIIINSLNAFTMLRIPTILIFLRVL